MRLKMRQAGLTFRRARSVVLPLRTQTNRSMARRTSFFFPHVKTRTRLDVRSGEDDVNIMAEDDVFAVMFVLELLLRKLRVKLETLRVEVPPPPPVVVVS